MAATKARIRNSPTRQDTWSIIVKYQGKTTGFWDKKTGGAVDSEESKYYPGHMEDPISLGGRKTSENVTLQRIFDGDDDMALLNKLVEGAGKSTVEVEQRAMDFDGNAYGPVFTYLGILKRVLPPETDSEGTGASMIEIEVSVIGFPHAI